MMTVALAAVACGDSALFGDGSPGGGNDDGSGGEGATTSESSSSGTTTSTSSGMGGDPSTTSTGTTTTSTGGNGGEPGTGGTGGMQGDKLLDCGDELCPVGENSACCWDPYQAYGQPQATCVTGSIANDQCATLHDSSGIETLITCQTPLQCGASQTCCADRETVQLQNQQVTLYMETSCQTSCNFPDIQLCNDLNSSADCPMLPTQGGGSVQGVCQQSQLLPPGYYVCGYP
jgi:hypothetical protein